MNTSDGLPQWLGPATGAVAFGTSTLLVALYFYGLSIPVQHTSSRTIVIEAPPDAVWSLLTEQRASWRPHVVRVVDCQTVAQMACWREFDAYGDRIEFVIRQRDDVAHQLQLSPAKPEDLGMAATWTWSLSPAEGGARTQVTLTEEGSIDNPLFRALWALREGPYAAIDLDLGAIAAASVPPGR